MINYLGSTSNTNNLHLQPGASERRTEDGLDIIDEVYAGPIPALKHWVFRNARKGASHPTHKGMYLVERGIEKSRSFAFVSCTWLGRKNDSEIDELPTISKRTGIKSATFSTESPEKAQREVSYRSPEIVLSYASDNEVIESRYGIKESISSLVNLQNEDESAFEMLRSVTRTDAGEVYYNTVPVALFTALFRTPGWYFIGLECSRIKHTPYWTNQETWSFQYAPE